MNFFLLQFLFLINNGNVLPFTNPLAITYFTEEDKKKEIQNKDKQKFKCNFFVANPKRVINPYRNQIENYVESKPFGSVCLKCNMCLAIAKEIDRIFQEVHNSHRYSKQEEAVILLSEQIKSLCYNGFENYDLRKFKQFQIVTDVFQCSAHVRSKMDGKWTEKLREICTLYSHYIDLHYLLYNYWTGSKDIANYLCRSGGIFRDCSSLDFKNTSLIPDDERYYYLDDCDE